MLNAWNLASLFLATFSGIELKIKFAILPEKMLLKTRVLICELSSYGKLSSFAIF
jgi:hypothetical protein